MMTKILFFLCVIAASVSNAQLYSSSSSKITFFSKTAMEDISAVNTTSKSAIDAKAKSVLVRVKVIAFKFDKPLMEEHFNEKYMESDKFPDAIFKGKITSEINFAKDGVYPVSVDGVLTMHGVDQPRTLQGTLEIKKGILILHCNFNVKLADHKIEVPSVVTEKIAESIAVDVNFTYAPYKKSK